MVTRTTIGQIAVAILMGCLLSAVLGAGVIAYSMIQTEQRARENQSRSRVLKTAMVPAVEGQPSVSQESIDKAVTAFQIKVPNNVAGPKLDMSLLDRGLTTRRGALSQITVTIGPDAFSSWSMLASTISHEVEVHCRQNFFAIHLMDLAGMDGTGQAEREAYRYELRNAARFGLAPYDQDLIRSTVNYYYPDTRSRFARQIAPVKFWMDRMSAIENKVRF